MASNNDRMFDNISAIERALQRHKDRDQMIGVQRSYSMAEPKSHLDYVEEKIDQQKKEKKMTSDKPFTLRFSFRSMEGRSSFNSEHYYHTYPEGFEQIEFVKNNIKKKDVDMNRVRIGVKSHERWNEERWTFKVDEVSASEFLKKVFKTRFDRHYDVSLDIVKLFTKTVIKSCTESTAKASFDWDVVLAYKFDKKAFLEAWINEGNDFIEEWNYITPVGPKQKPIPITDDYAPTEAYGDKSVVVQWWGMFRKWLKQEVS